MVLTDSFQLYFKKPFFFFFLDKLFLPPALRKGSDLEKAFATAALVYNNHADPENKLSKSETKSLLQSQFWHFIQVRGSAGWVALDGHFGGRNGSSGSLLQLGKHQSAHGEIPSET